MMLVDGGKVVDYTAEEGYYTVQNSSLPSLFNGQFGDALKESFNRVRYGGQTPYAQKVYYINLQEIKGIKFGTRTPINYFDLFYNSELFLRAADLDQPDVGGWRADFLCSLQRQGTGTLYGGDVG